MNSKLDTDAVNGVILYFPGPGELLYSFFDFGEVPITILGGLLMMVLLETFGLHNIFFYE